MKPKQGGLEIEMENNIKYWLRENLSTLPMSLRYEELLELNEPILISSVLKITEVLLSRQRAEIVGEIRKMKKGKPEIKYRMVSDRVDWLNDGYQLALSDILSALEKGEK